MQVQTNGEVQVVDHPLAFIQLSVLRNRETQPNEFRCALRKLALHLLLAAARSWGTDEVEMESPLRKFTGAVARRPVALVPILRAGLGLQDGMLPLIPEANIGHIGLYRDPESLRPVKYFSRLPANIAESQVLVLDPMLATGHSAVEAVTIVKAAGAKHVQLICVLGCPEGIAELHRAHADVPIVAAAIDPILNDVGYIVPGLGDAGDRYFGTA